MKYILSILFLIPIFCFGQGHDTMGTKPNQILVNNGVFCVKGDLLIPNKDTSLKNCCWGELGGIRIFNGIFYYWNGFAFTTPAQGASGVPLQQMIDSLVKRVAYWDSLLGYTTHYDFDTSTKSIWSKISTISGGTDTGGLSYRINQRVKYSDTSSMLSPYIQKWLADLLYQPILGYTPENVANKVSSFTAIDNVHYPTTQAVVNYVSANSTDTGGLSYRINQRVKYSDTASMLSIYLPKWLATLLYQPVLGYTPENVANKATNFSTLNNTLYPTTQAVANYVSSNATDTGGLSFRINQRVKYSDTAAMLSPYLPSWLAALTYVPLTRTLTINGTTFDLSSNRTWNVGTVTSVSAGAGLSGGTFTTTGTVSMPNVGTASTHGTSKIVPQITTDAQGRVSMLSDVAIDYSWSNISSLPTVTYTGDVTGTATLGSTVTLSLPNVGTAGTYGSSSLIPIITTDAKGRITSITTGSPTGANATSIQGVAIYTTAPTNPSYLKYDGTKWGASSLAIGDPVSGGSSYALFYHNVSGQWDEILNGTSGQVLVATTSGKPTWNTFSGDFTTSNTLVAALATVNSNTGNWGSATQTPTVTVDGKGRITAIGNVTMSTNLTSMVTGILPYANGGTNASTSWTYGSVASFGYTSMVQDNLNHFYSPYTHKLSVNCNGDTTGSDAINVYGEIDMYQLNSAQGAVNSTTMNGTSTSASRGTSVSPLILQSGDIIGNNGFWGYSNTGTPAYYNMCGMVGKVTGSGGANGNGGQIDFYTKADNSTSYTSVLSILSTGHYILEGVTTTGASGTGNIIFGTSPTMTNPVVGTQTNGDNSTKAASTAYVENYFKDTTTTNFTTSMTPVTPVTGTLYPVTYNITAQAGALLFNNPIGTWANHQPLVFYVTGTAARALTYGTNYMDGTTPTLTKPSTTVTTTMMIIQFEYNSGLSKFILTGFQSY